MEEFIRQKTECAVCLLVFVEPRILPCLHTFCCECVEKLKQDGPPATVICPYCATTAQYRHIKVDFNTQELVDVRLAQEKSAAASPQNSDAPGRGKSEVRAARTRREQLEQHMKDVELARAEIRDCRAKVQQRVAAVLECKATTLQRSGQLREQCAARLEKCFENVDTQVIEYCREKSAEVEATLADLSKIRLVSLEELEWTRDSLRNQSNCEEVNTDYIRELGQRLGRLTIKPEIARDGEGEFVIDLLENEAWMSSEPVTLKFPQESEKDLTKEGDTASQSAAGLSVLELSRREFRLLQEKQLDATPYTVRVVHGEAWVCTDHGIAVHAGEIHGLEESRRIRHEDFGRRVFDVAELPNEQAVVAAEKGLFIVYITGQIMKKLSCGRHTSVVVAGGGSKLVAAGELETSTLAVLYTYHLGATQQWARDDMLYLPEACLRGQLLTVHASDALIYVSNAHADKLYILSWSGQLASEHGVSNTIRLQKEGGFIAYNFNNSIEKKHANYGGIVSQPRISMRDETGLLIADHDNYRFQVFDARHKWHSVKLAPLACTGAALLSRNRMLVACRFNDVQLSGSAKYNIMKNCLQLYEIH